MDRKFDCQECLDQKTYWTEWSDSAESDLELKKLVIFYPNPPDGMVLIRCGNCSDGS